MTLLSHSIAFFTSFVSPSIATSLAHCTMATPPSIATVVPYLHSLSTSSSSPYSNRITSSHYYNLCSHTLFSGIMTHPAGLGLTLPDSTILSSQGRKLDLSKAVKQAGAELASGWQSTVDGVLRALNSLGRVPPWNVYHLIAEAWLVPPRN